jgi:hypothetical protein
MVSLAERDGFAWMHAGRLAAPGDILELIGAAHGVEAVLVLPVDRLDPAFFELRSGLMGELAQKLTTYGHRAAILGDTAFAEGSRAFRDFRTETNRGRVLAILPDTASLAQWA